MRSVAEIGLKISAALRENYHYSGVSAELERRGAGSSRPELSWLWRRKREDERQDDMDKNPHDNGPGSEETS